MVSFKKNNKGFTLLELLVTLSIFVIMTTLLLANQHRFSNTLDLTNLAFDVSLTIRQAQTYGYSVRAQGTTGTDADFKNFYGVHFDIGNPDTFFIFADSSAADSDNQGKYDSRDDVKINSYTLKKGFVIDEICKVNGSTETCNYSPSNTLDIVFKRPNPEAAITFYSSASGGPLSSQYQTNQVRIKLKSTDNKYKAIDIYKSGQVSVVDISS